MQNRLGITFTFYVLLTIAYCGGALAQQTQPTAGEQPTQPQVSTEPTSQPATPPATEPTLQSQPSPAPAPAPKPPLVEPAQSECAPKCRKGYICQQGACISVCNPPCASDQECTEDGACVSKQPAPQYTAYSRDEDKPRYQHTGFFLRFTAGVGWSNVEAPYSIENEGFTGFGAFDIGGAVSENVILHARMAGVVNAVNKDVTIDLDEQIETKAETVSYGLFGGGLTYYFMPSNIYMTFVLGLAGVGYTVDKDDWHLSDEDLELTEEEEEAIEDDLKDNLEQAEFGVGFDIDIGKEWWVGSEWGLGIAGRLSYSSVSPNDNAESDDWLNCVGVGVLFTATFN